MPNPRWKIKPAGSTWGDFGPDDQLGRLNLVTPEKVKQGVAEVREGKAFCLSMPLDYPGGSILNPRRKPPVLSPTAARRQAEHGLSAVARRSRSSSTWCATTSCCSRCSIRRNGTRLAHVGQQFDVDGDGKPEMVFYNGFRAGEHD